MNHGSINRVLIEVDTRGGNRETVVDDEDVDGVVAVDNVQGGLDGIMVSSGGSLPFGLKGAAPSSNPPATVARTFREYKNLTAGKAFMIKRLFFECSCLLEF